MSGPIEVMCSRCDGTGKVETVWRTIYAGWMECQARCLACAGTGWVPIDTIPGWVQARAEAIRADQLRRHEAGLAADLAYQAGAATDGEVEQ